MAPALTDGTQRRHTLYEIDFAVPVYWTDCPLPIAYGGHMWTPKPTQVSSITSKQLEGAGATMVVGNASNFLSSLFFAGGVKGKVVKIWIAAFDLATPSQEPYDVIQVYDGKIDTMTITNSGGTVEATITLGPEVEQSSKMLPARRLTDLLRHDP